MFAFLFVLFLTAYQLQILGRNLILFSMFDYTTNYGVQVNFLSLKKTFIKLGLVLYGMDKIQSFTTK